MRVDFASSQPSYRPPYRYVDGPPYRNVEDEDFDDPGHPRFFG